MLIDSGADENTVSMGMLSHLFGNKLPKIYSSQFKKIVMADGQQMVDVLGTVYLTLKIRNSKFRNTFHIKNTPIRSVILGNRLLRDNSEIIKFA